MVKEIDTDYQRRPCANRNVSPLSPTSDQHQISPWNINRVVMRRSCLIFYQRLSKK